MLEEELCCFLWQRAERNNIQCVRNDCALLRAPQNTGNRLRQFSRLYQTVFSRPKTCSFIPLSQHAYQVDTAANVTGSLQRLEEIRKRCLSLNTSCLAPANRDSCMTREKGQPSQTTFCSLVTLASALHWSQTLELFQIRKDPFLNCCCG